ncbi:MAG: FtsX-like permease family protein, partial [Acidobacteriota bacterium]|nr:FtsX-like permease family protein [Acidobacteriota bacterium]
ISGGVRQTLLILMSAVGLLLFVACANVASLLLVRGASRVREFAIRSAIGAGRARVARQLLTENLAIALLGGILGLPIAFGCLRALIVMAPGNLPRVAEISLDVPVLLFAAAVTILTGLLAGIAPVFASTKIDVSIALKDGAAAPGRSARGQRFRSALVTGEIAITLLLSFVSGVLIRSLIAAQSTDPGFNTKDLLALQLQAPASTYKTDGQIRQFFNAVTETLRHQPEVLNAGVVTCAPGAGDCGDWWYSPMDRPAPARPEVPLTLFFSADTGYFRTMGIRIVAGRDFTVADSAGSTPVAVVNQEIARKWWKEPREAIGKLIKFGGPYMDGSPVEIVGVAHNVSQMGLDGEQEPQMYFPLAQKGSRTMTVMLRTRGDPATLSPTVRRAIATLDRNLPVKSLDVYESTLGATLSRRRFTTLLLTVFAGLAMFLAAVGIYGVLNYWVSMRTREIAVRMALGASRPAILQWVSGGSLRLALSGLLLGAGSAWMASRWLGSLVYGVTPQSPLTMAIAALAVLLLAAAASALPAWRATHVEITKSLRDS